MSLDKEKFKELEKRVKKFQKNEKIYSVIGVSSIFLPFTPLFLWYFVRRFIGILSPVSFWEAIPLGFLGLLVWYILIEFSSKKQTMYKIDDDEWKAFYTKSILENLEKYSKTTNKGFRKDYRNNALKIAKEFLSCIENRWKVGPFKPVREYRDTISDLKKNLRFRVIPYIKDGDDELLKKIERIMYNFAYYGLLTLEGIDKLNTQMSQDLPTTEQLKVGFSEKWRRFFTTHRIFRHSLVMAGFVVICIMLGYVGLVYVEGLPMEGVWVGSIALFVGLASIYFRKQPKGE